MSNLFQYWEHSSFYLQRKVYYYIAIISASFALSFFIPVLFFTSQLLLLLLAVLILIDAFFLYRLNGIVAVRHTGSRWDLGENNEVTIEIGNNYPHTVFAEVIDELPIRFQDRNWRKHLQIPAHSNASITYQLKPAERGDFDFGRINVFASGKLQLVQRRYTTGLAQRVKVYPSYRQMRKYQLMAAGTVQHTGVKRMRRLGHSLEFEQIKEYVSGDDFRTINWKASSRRGDLMVNNYTDEKSQPIYCLINKGRAMKMPFGGLTLLDYSINAALAITGVAISKGDKAGLICFSKEVDAFVPADKKSTQVALVLENLYNQQTGFPEPDYEKLFSAVRIKITQRSLLILFTNYESIHSLRRDMPMLKRLAHYHLLLVVYFENSEVAAFAKQSAATTEEIYIRTIAESYLHEKKLIASELQNEGILTVYTSPGALSINLLNKYLELKTKRSI